MMERMNDAIESVKDYVSDKVETIRDYVDEKIDTAKDFYVENKDEIHSVVYFAGSVSALLYMSKQHMDDTDKIYDLNTRVESLACDNKKLMEENQRLSKAFESSDTENKKLKEKMEENFKTFKKIASDGTRHGSSESARQLANLAHSEAYKETDWCEDPTEQEIVVVYMFWFYVYRIVWISQIVLYTARI